MSSAANHRKRSHRSEGMHRQASTKYHIYAINKMNRKISFLDRSIRFTKRLAVSGRKKESDQDESDN